MSRLDEAFDHLATDLRAGADPDRARQMAAYMKNRFPFLGVASPERKLAQKPFLAATRTATADEVLDLADRCWDVDEREFHYVGCDLLRARSKTLQPTDLDRLYSFVTTNSWWDTVDSLASHPVGTLVGRFDELGAVMDEWIDDADIWVARTAILHQLRYKESLNEERLFGYVLKRAGDNEFFIRKALGWALRSHARVAPVAVRTFVEQHQSVLSGLTKREALKNL